jgi:hypothetical protein
MPIALDRLNLHGAAELARFLIDTTVGAQRFISGVCGVGGPVNVATITAADGLRWVRRQDQRRCRGTRSASRRQCPRTRPPMAYGWQHTPRPHRC